MVLREEEAATRDGVLQRDSLDGDGTVLEDDLVLAGVDGMEDDIEL